MEPSTSKRWIVAAIVLAVVGVVAGAWLLDQFRQPQSGFEFERLDEPPDEHFVLNQTTYGDLVPAVREAIRDAASDQRPTATGSLASLPHRPRRGEPSPAPDRAGDLGKLEWGCLLREAPVLT